MCHLNKLPRVVREEDAKAYREQMAMPDLVFKTPENAAMLEAEAKRIAEAQEQAKEPMQ